MATVLLVVGLADSWAVCSANYRYLFAEDSQKPASSNSFLQYWNDGLEIQTITYIAQANLGAVNCTSHGYYVSRGGVLGYNEPGYHGEYSLSGNGTVTETDWSPNSLRFDLSADSAATLVINQNFDEGWTIAYGHGMMASKVACLQ